MKVLVVGGGGREHAVVDALSRSPQVSKIYCAPGNAGIARQAECVPVKDTDVEGLLSLAREKEIDLTVVGPEAALVAGIVDRFREEGLRIFGPTKAAARIESSKEFAKDLMGRYGIPTAGYRAFDDYRKASEYVRSRERVSLSPGRWRRPMPRCATCCWTTSSARDVWSWRIF